MSLRRDIARVQYGVETLRGAVHNAQAVPGPAQMMQAAGMEPDEWQHRLFETTHRRTLQLVTRQGGKSTSTAAKALSTALMQPGSLTLLLSPSLRQSRELFAKVASLYRASGEPVGVGRFSTEHIEFVHGSRIVALPGTEKTVRGFSGVDLLIIDEAARVLDELYHSVRPMLAVSGGELVCMSTPWGKRGWFYEAWTSAEDWQRIKVTAYDCGRIAPEFLEEERRTLPDSWFRSEYLCEFTDTVDSVFRSEDIEAAFSADVPLLFDAGGPEGGTPSLPVIESATIERLAV